jgi:2-C-methyl-D-erythritol 4-phosphate cytidylyltransferase
MNHEGLNIAVIVGAGNGTRFNADKIFAEINQKPIWYYSALAFQSSEKVDEIIMVVKEEKIKKIQEQKEIYGLDKIKEIVLGGIERRDSVLNALKIMDKKRTNLVLVHDAARPLVSKNLIDNCIDEADKFRAVVPGIWPRDTIKRGKETVEETLNRNELQLIQTPQVFSYDILKKAYENAIENNISGTDDSSLVEKMGYRVKIIPGDESNFKITYPKDLELATFLMTRC